MTHVTERAANAAAGDDVPDDDREYRRTVTYADAGVSIHAGESAVELLKTKVHAHAGGPRWSVTSAASPACSGWTCRSTSNPILASSADGVGTKLTIAQQMDIHDTVGIDLVAMVVDDLVACGAEPLFLLDYIACGEVVPERVAEIASGIADGCRTAGCALLGGETAEHPGVMRANEYDMPGPGSAWSRVTRSSDRDRVAPGRRGHRDGLVRAALQRVLAGTARTARDRPDAPGQRRRGLRQAAHPRRGAADPDPHLRQGLPRPRSPRASVRAFAHITGGGISGNLVRVLPDHVDAMVDRSTWRPQPIFDLVQRKGRIEQSEMEIDVQHGRRHDGDRLARRHRPGAGLPAPAARSRPGGPARSSMVRARSR